MSGAGSIPSRPSTSGADPLAARIADAVQRVADNAPIGTRVSTIEAADGERYTVLEYGGKGNHAPAAKEAKVCG